MKLSVAAIGVAVLAVSLGAQEKKPVPKNSQRVSIPGCARGYIFTAGRRTADQPGSADIPEGMHLRMNGPKSMISEIKAHEGSMIEITGLVRKGQLNPSGVGIGGGVRISPGPGSSGGTTPSAPMMRPVDIDLEGWRPAVGDCPAR